MKNSQLMKKLLEDAKNHLLKIPKQELIEKYNNSENGEITNLLLYADVVFDKMNLAKNNAYYLENINSQISPWLKDSNKLFDIHFNPISIKNHYHALPKGFFVIPVPDYKSNSEITQGIPPCSQAA